MVGVSCRACGDGQQGPPASGDGESCPGGGWSVLQGLWGRRTGHTGLGGWGVQPRGWSEFPAGPAGMDNRAHRPGGMGSPAQGVVGVSCRACGGVEPGTPAQGGWGVQPRGWSEFPAGPAGMHNRALRPGGMGSPVQGVVGASCRACGDVEPGTPAWGDGESCPGGGRSVVQGLWGRRTGHTGVGGWGVQPRGWSEFPAGPAGMDIRAHRPGGTGSPAQGVVGVSCRVCGDAEPGIPAWGDGESYPGGGRSFLQGLWGWTTGPTGLGGWGVLPRGWWSVLQGLWGRRTGHTGLGRRGVLPRGWPECPAGPVGT